MAFSSFKKGEIKGIYCVYPPDRKCIDDEKNLNGVNRAKIERIKNAIGLKERYVVDKRSTSADLCERAGNRMLEEMKIARDKIDALICVTQTPDYFQPSNAACLQGKLGLKNECCAFDVNLGCSGYVYGLWLAFMMIEAGGLNNVLLLAGDTMSKCVNPKDLSVSLLFGDAGTATLIQNTGKNNDSCFSLCTDGKGYNNLIIPAGAFRTPKNEETSREMIDENGNVRSMEDLYMNGAEIFNFSIREVPESVKEIMGISGKKQEDIHYIIFHQANKYLISNIVRRLEFPVEKAPCGTVEKYGNQSSASIPFTICDAIQEEIRNGRRTIIMSGFGVGLSWASCLTNLEDVLCGIEIYKREN